MRRARTNRRKPQIEPLEPRTLLAGSAIPQVALDIPAETLIGTQLHFSVGFQNSSPTTPGYSPYIDLILPRTGDEGASPANPDGITFVSATYLGLPLTSTVLTFDSAGHATHPYAVSTSGSHLVINGTSGDQLAVLQLPFASFTPGQPSATISVTANLSNQADVGFVQTIRSEGGFALGNTPLNDHAIDPSIVGTQVSGAVTGRLFILNETYLGPENEMATGPNFPRQNQITLAIAPGQTLTNLDLNDSLPNNLQSQSVVETSIRGTAVATIARSTPSTATPGGTLTRRFASVTGTGAANDVSMTFQYDGPLNNVSVARVIDPTTGAAVTSADTAGAQGSWTPLNSSDAPGAAASNTTTHVLNDRSLATQKSVSTFPTSPGLAA